MKKFVCLLLCAVLIVCGTLALVGCDKEESLPDLADCEIGYQLPVYPNCEFIYKLSDNNTDYNINIKSITATLTEKTTIAPGDTLDSNFSPFIVKIKVTGTANLPVNTKITIRLHYGTNYFLMTSAIINENGSFLGEEDTTKILYNSKIYFYSIIIAK